MNITESIKFNKLKEENEALKNEITELKQQQLYKKDIWIDFIRCEECEEEIEISGLTKGINKITSEFEHFDECMTKMYEDLTIL
ncbi:hypothetical protein C6B38_08910 [Spiroplasma sp. ChiS]|uniref:hypothetical protein n=1 Tax=Spiroplasma sp. ChiS TaxID=2099885 RepID=UPI000CF901BB|nr:hypothetical protein [Spiroplasma sp. ChiS]PQP77995.1 hypothetical protein C6B38_08910 [Spiroplasma sp. ChiS]